MTATEALSLRKEFSHYTRSLALIHEDGRGDLIEYRRIYTPDRPVIFLESRLLGPGGHPYDDCPDDGPWYLVSDEEWQYLIHHAADLMDELCGLRA